MKTRCKSSSLICVAGGLKNQDKLTVIGCANCFSVLSQTKTLNSPKILSGIYWYYTPNFSFGFAQTPEINQNTWDNTDLTSNYKLSWNLDKAGGQRLGNLTDLGSSTDYMKYVYVLV